MVYNYNTNIKRRSDNMVKSIIEQRKLMQGAELDDDGDDFTVGTIAGLEPLDKEDKEIVKNIRHLNKSTKNQPKGDVADMTNATIEKQIENAIDSTNVVTPEQLEGTVELKLRKTYQPLVQTIVNNNDNVIVQEFDNYFQLNAKQIKVSRTDGERALGRLNDGSWRMLFMNKKGEVANFTDYEFTLGVVEEEAEAVKETAQLNTRIDSKAKLDMDETREMLGMTQAKFLEVAIAEYVAKVKSEMIL
jgi:hypothetical protein